jgi:hypothetical protein
MRLLSAANAHTIPMEIREVGKLDKGQLGRAEGLVDE